MPIVLYGKTYCDERGSDTYSRMRYFWEAGRDTPGGFGLRLPQPLGYYSEIKTLWTLALPGTTLVDVIDHSNYVHYFRQIGRGLATIHNSDLRSSTISTVNDRLAECLKKIRKICAVCPSCAEPLADVTHQIRLVGERLAGQGRPARPIHGDFYIDQLAVHGSDLSFFDFDAFAMGDPEQDLAEFIVALLFRQMEPEWVRSLSIALLESYRANVSWRVQLDRLYWYALVEYISKAYRCYARQEPGWANTLQRSLANLSILDTMFIA